MNNLADAQKLFERIVPWSGFVPRGYGADFLGIFTDFRFHVLSDVNPMSVGGGEVSTELPAIREGENAEGWFEAVNWLASAREAKDRYIMVTLGAHYGAQAVGAYKTVQLIKPMPCKLVGVEPVAENYAWMLQHMQTNGINPDDHWLVQMAISDSHDPIYFPVGAHGTGANNSYSTNEIGARKSYIDFFIQQGKTDEALRNLLLHNTTGIQKDLLPGRAAFAEIKLLSSITLQDVVGPFDVIDYIESDIQQSEILVFPPCIDILRKKVRRIHIGTHGNDVHQALFDLFDSHGWQIIFSFAPNECHKSELGVFTLNDGILTVRNPNL